MNVFTYPLISGEHLFVLLVVVAMLLASVTLRRVRGASSWRQRVSPGALVAFASVLGIYLVAAEIDDSRKHYCAVHRDCVRREGIVETHVHGGTVPSVDVVVAGHTFTLLRGSLETYRILAGLSAGGASRRYVVCSDRSGTILRVDRVRRRARRKRR